MNDRRLTTRYYIKLGDSVWSVSWQVKKQSTASSSSYEAEYKSLASAVQEAILLRGIQREHEHNQCEPRSIGQDNQRCIKLVTAPMLHKRSKHITSSTQFNLNASRRIGSRSSDKVFASAEIRTTSWTTTGRVQILTWIQQAEWGIESQKRT